MPINNEVVARYYSNWHAKWMAELQHLRTAIPNSTDAKNTRRRLNYAHSKLQQVERRLN